MQPETKKNLHDIACACESILEFTAGKNLTDCNDDLSLCSSVECQFEIIDEAINKSARIDRVTAGYIEDYGQKIASEIF